MDPLGVGLVSFGRGGSAADVAVLEAVGRAFDAEEVGVVDEKLDHGGGDGVIAEYFAPPAEGVVGGRYGGGSFVAGGEESEEQVRRFGLEGHVVDLVNEQQRAVAPAFHLVGYLPLPEGS